MVSVEFWLLSHAVTLQRKRTRTLYSLSAAITKPPIGEPSVVTSVCLSVCVCLSAIVSSELYFRSSPNFSCVLSFAVARPCSGGVVVRHVFMVLWMTSCLLGVARKPRLLDVAAQLKRSAHAALGLAVNCAQ